MFKLLALSLALLGAPVWASGLPTDYEPPKSDTDDYVALNDGYKITYTTPVECGENCAQTRLRIIDGTGGEWLYSRVDGDRVIFSPVAGKAGLNSFNFMCNSKPSTWVIKDRYYGVSDAKVFSTEGLQAKICRTVYPNGRDTARTIYLTTLCQFSDDPKKCVKEMQEAGHIE